MPTDAKSEFVSIEFTKRSLEIIERLDDMPELLVAGIRTGIDRAQLHVISRLQRRRFRGNGPFDPTMNKLGRISGLLARSLGMTPAEIRSPSRLKVESEAGPIHARTASVRKYFAVHEFGLKETVVVVSRHKRKAHTRKNRPVKAHEVNIHTRTMNMPERAPMRTGLREKKTLALFADSIEEAIVEQFESI